MEFEWDENKNRKNIEKHGIGFERAKAIFDGKILSRIDDRYDYGETREISLGLMEGVTIIVVVHTKRKTRTRLISARKANQEEKKVYHEFTRKEHS